jgi:2-polyprenyl-3-methyl-5-hydroxy-6-metoxy-1,4-benzoquinol methylase
MSRNFNSEIEDNSFRAYNYGFDVITRQFLLQEFSRNFDSNSAKVLEVGSYDGSMTELILDYFEEIDVVEASSKMANVVREKFGHRVSVHEGMIEEIEIQDRFDAIFLIHTLEHVTDPTSVLIKLKSLLAEKGKIFIAVPNANALSRQIAVNMGIIKFNHDVPDGEAAQGHLRTYSLDTLLFEFKKADLRVIDSGGVILKALANFQLDAALSAGIIDEKYIQAANELAKKYPDFSTSIYAVVSAGN